MSELEVRKWGRIGSILRPRPGPGRDTLGSRYKAPPANGGRQGDAQGRAVSASAQILRAYMRPPPDDKGEEARKGPYAAILRRFGQELSSSDACIVIGYSFRDPHISREPAKFAGRGKALVVLGPTAATDFEANALEGVSKFRAWDGRGARGRPHNVVLPSGYQRGTAYTLD